MIIGNLPTFENTMDLTATAGSQGVSPTNPQMRPSTAPVTAAGQPVVVQLGTNGSVEVLLRSHDPDGDPLNTTLATHPAHGKLYDIEGVPLFVGDRIRDPSSCSEVGVGSLASDSG